MVLAVALGKVLEYLADKSFATQATSLPLPLETQITESQTQAQPVVALLAGMWIGTTVFPEKPFRGTGGSTGRTPRLAPIRAEGSSRRIADRLLAFTTS